MFREDFGNSLGGNRAAVTSLKTTRWIVAKPGRVATTPNDKGRLKRLRD